MFPFSDLQDDENLRARKLCQTSECPEVTSRVTRNDSGLRPRAPLARRALQCLRGAPLRKELRDERMFVVTLDGQRCQRERYGESCVITERSRRGRAKVGGMDVVDPDRVINESSRAPDRRLSIRPASEVRTAPAGDGRRRSRALLPLPHAGVGLSPAGPRGSFSPPC